MHTLRKAIYAWSIALGIAWGLLLNVAGWHVLAQQTGSADDQTLRLCLGIMALAAGNFVFMAIVADRVIQTPRRGPLDLLEFATGAAMLIAAAMSAALLLTAGGLG